MARIVHLCPRYAPAQGGVESFFRRLGSRLVSRGDTVDVWTTDAPTVRSLTQPLDPRLPAGPESIDGVTTRRFPVNYFPFQRILRTAGHVLPFGRRWKCETLRWTPFVPSMTREARRCTERIDLVHVAGLPYTSLLFAGLTLARRTGAKLVMSPFTHLPPPGAAGQRMRRAYLSPLNMQLLNEADMIFVQTSLERRVLTEAGVVHPVMHVVGVGVDADDVRGGDRARARKRWGVSADAIVIGHLGNKSWEKGTIDLVEAMRHGWDRDWSAALVLAGAEMPAFTTYLAKSPVRDRVVNLPLLSDDERRDFFAGIDVFALPSYVESFGISPLEAAWCGAAIVAYDHGGPSELFEDGVSARIVKAGGVQTLFDAIAELGASPSLRERLVAGARDVARAHTWEAALGRALAAYDSEVGTHGATS